MTRPSFNVSLAGPWQASWSGGSDQGSAQTKMTAETISGVKRRRPPGWVEPTPYAFVRERQDNAVGHVKRETVDTSTGSILSSTQISGALDNPYWGSSSINLWNEAYSLPAAPPTSFVDRAIIKARLQMKGTSVNLGVAFAERNATARMLGTNAIAMAKAMRALRRGDWNSALKALGLSRRGEPRSKSIPKRWLELQYGWNPLLSDVYGACDALQQRDTSAWMVTGKGSYSEKSSLSKDCGSFLSRCDTHVQSRMGAYVRIDAEPTNGLAGTFTALGLTNPLLIAWELVPFSFVVDWALPIGSWLDSLDAMLGYGPTWCSTSTICRGNWVSKHRGTIRENGPYVETTSGSWESRREIVRLNRTVSQSVPLPTLPRFKDPRSLTHMANGLSLLALAFRGR